MYNLESKKNDNYLSLFDEFNDFFGDVLGKDMKTKKKGRLRRILLVLLCVCLAAGLIGLGVNAWVRRSVSDRILTPAEAAAETLTGAFSRGRR